MTLDATPAHSSCTPTDTEAPASPDQAAPTIACARCGAPRPGPCLPGCLSEDRFTAGIWSLTHATLCRAAEDLQETGDTSGEIIERHLRAAIAETRADWPARHEILDHFSDQEVVEYTRKRARAALAVAVISALGMADSDAYTQFVDQELARLADIPSKDQVNLLWNAVDIC